MRSLWRAKGRRAGVHIDRGHKGAHDHRCPGTNQLRIGDTGQNLGHHLGQGARHRHRGHRAAHNKRRNDRRLVIGRKNLQRAHHNAVKCHRAVDIDQRGHHGVVLHELFAKQDATHIHTVLRA